MISTNTLIYVGLLCAGWLIRHKFPPQGHATTPTPVDVTGKATVSAPAASSAPLQGKILAPAGGDAPVPANPYAQTHPVLTALVSQGESVLEGALHDWLANGIPSPAGSDPKAADASHPLLSAAMQVASQAGQQTQGNVLASLVQALQQQAVSTAASPAGTVVK